MIDIVKLLNGNIGIYDTTSGDFIRSLSPDIVEIACNANGVVKVKQDNASVEYFDPAEVANTQVLPAAAVPFTGDCAALASLFATDFFFVVSGGGGGTVFEGYYPSGTFQDFLTIKPFLVAPSYPNDGFYGGIRRIKYECFVEDFRVRQISATTGTGIVGIYKYDNSANVWNKVVSETGLDLTSTATQVFTHATPVKLEPGIYAFGWHVSNSAQMLSIDAAAVDNIFGVGSNLANTSNNTPTLFSFSKVYDGTLPNQVAVFSLVTTSNFNPYTSHQIQ